MRYLIPFYFLYEFIKNDFELPVYTNVNIIYTTIMLLYIIAVLLLNCKLC